MSRSKIESNLYRPVEERSYVELLNGGGFFSKFEYQSDPYGEFLDKERAEKRMKEHKQQLVHGEKPFYTVPKKEMMFKH